MTAYDLTKIDVQKKENQVKKMCLFLVHSSIVTIFSSTVNIKNGYDQKSKEVILLNFVVSLVRKLHVQGVARVEVAGNASI